MGAFVVAGMVAYGMALLCVPITFGRHRHPLIAAHCRSAGIVRGSRDEIAAFDLLCSLMSLARWLLAATFVWSDLRLLAVVVAIEAVFASAWAGQRMRMVVHRRHRRAARKRAA